MLRPRAPCYARGKVVTVYRRTAREAHLKVGSKTGCEPPPASASPPTGDPFIMPVRESNRPRLGLGCADTIITRTSSPEVNTAETTRYKL